jgi:hypothetical protein
MALLIIGYLIMDDYLVIGEVRDGMAAMSLFRALMTGHSGACTFHADSPREAGRRLATVMRADAGVKAGKCGRPHYFLSKLELKTIQDFRQPKLVKHQEMTEKDR